MSHVKNIAIVGGAGQSGSHIVKSLLESGKFDVTAITRSESSSTFPSAVKVHKGSYDSEEFLESALQEQEVFIIILGTTAPKDLQTRLIKAASAASVPWILPCEFGPDADSEELNKGLPILAAKKYYRDQIENFGKSSWISFNCGFWFDFVRCRSSHLRITRVYTYQLQSLAGGFFGLKIIERVVKLFDDGNTKLSTTTLPHVGRAVAKLLELPIDKLERYKNGFVYVQSFCVSQMEIFNALKKATGTTDQDWQISKIPVDQAIAQGNKEAQNENRAGMIDVLYGMNFKPGMGGNFQHKIDNELLGLYEEDLDEVVKSVVHKLEA
jgi:hypothetical protein